MVLPQTVDLQQISFVCRLQLKHFVQNYKIHNYIILVNIVFYVQHLRRNFENHAKFVMLLMAQHTLYVTKMYLVKGRKPITIPQKVSSCSYGLKLSNFKSRSVNSNSEK